MKLKVKKLVWHIFRFQQRYELPEDLRMCRKSGLQYSRDFVGVSAGNEAAGYHTQFGLLCNGDGLESLMLFGLYRKLVNLAAEHSRAKRGYLLDADDQPLTDGQIAKLFNLPAKDMRKFLRRFSAVKLIERIELPVFDLTKNELPARLNPVGDMGSDTKKRPPRTRKPRKKARAREIPGNSGEKHAPLKKRAFKKRQKRNTVSITKEKQNCPNEQKAPNGATAFAEAITKKRQRRAKQVQAQEGDQLDGQAPIAEAEPLKPRIVDAPGPAMRVIPFDRALGSISPAEPGAGVFGAVYDRHDFRTGVRIYTALGYRWSIDSPEGLREICSFASTIHKLLERLRGQPPTVVDEFALRLIREAVKIGRRRSKQNCGAVWTTVVNKIADARLRTGAG